VKFDQEIKFDITKHLYDPAVIEVNEDATILKSDKEIENVQSLFSDELPPRGVAIYTTMK
jgi:hypothetical protein